MFLAASPVLEAVYAILQDPTLQALVTGGIHTDLPENVSFPAVLLVIAKEKSFRGFGTGGLPELTLQAMVYSAFPGQVEAKEATRQIIALLRDVPLVVTGYKTCGKTIWDETHSFPDQSLNGVKVHEVVSVFRIYVEE